MSQKSRGSRDFERIEAYEAWLAEMLEGRNVHRRDRLADDLAAMTPLNVGPLAEHVEHDAPVTGASTIRVVVTSSYSRPVW